MTTIQIELPDEVARRARSAGLLSDSAIERLLEDAMRRRAGRALMDAARDIQDAGIPPMSMDEIDAAVKEVRAGRRVRAAAVSASADLIVSGDNHLSVLGSHGVIRIVTPADAIAVLAA